MEQKWNEQQRAPCLGSMLRLVLIPTFCPDHLHYFTGVLRNIRKSLSLSDMCDESSLGLIPPPPICDNFSSHKVPITEWCRCVIVSLAAWFSGFGTGLSRDPQLVTPEQQPAAREVLRLYPWSWGCRPNLRKKGSVICRGLACSHTGREVN